DLRPGPRDVRRPRGERASRRAETAPRGTPGRLSRAGRGAPLFLVTGLELLPELGVMPGDHQRVGVGAAIGLELAQRAAPVVLVGNHRRLLSPFELLPVVRRAPDPPEVPPRQPEDDRHVPRTVAGGVGEPNRAVAEEVDGPPERTV